MWPLFLGQSGQGAFVWFCAFALFFWDNWGFFLSNHQEGRGVWKCAEFSAHVSKSCTENKANFCPGCSFTTCFMLCQAMTYTCVRSWRSRSPPHHTQLTVSVFQRQGPRPAGMWFLHWWDQQMHQRHWAGLPCSCQPEPGHQGWHLCWGKGAASLFLLLFLPFEDFEAQSAISKLRRVLAGILLGKITCWPSVSLLKHTRIGRQKRGESSCV